MASLPVSPAVVYDDNDDDVADRSQNVNAGPMPTERGDADGDLSMVRGAI